MHTTCACKAAWTLLTGSLSGHRVSLQRSYFAASRGPLFALIGRPRRDSASTWVDDVSNPLPLTVALLLARHRASPGAGVTPLDLLRDLGALWPGDGRDKPGTIAFLRSFPALFTTTYEHRPGSRGLHPHLIRLSPAALALATAAAGSPPPPACRYSSSPALSPEARALLQATPLHWLPVLTPSPCADTWGPLLEGLLAAEGHPPTGRMALPALLPRIQALALAQGLAMPPNSAHWFALSPHPRYARIRPLWDEQLGLQAEQQQQQAAGRLRANRGLVAVELAPLGCTALQEDLQALAELAEQARARRGLGGK